MKKRKYEKGQIWNVQGFKSPTNVYYYHSQLITPFILFFVSYTKSLEHWLVKAQAKWQGWGKLSKPKEKKTKNKPMRLS